MRRDGRCSTADSHAWEQRSGSMIHRRPQQPCITAAPACIAAPAACTAFACTDTVPPAGLRGSHSRSFRHPSPARRRGKRRVPAQHAPPPPRGCRAAAGFPHAPPLRCCCLLQRPPIPQTASREQSLPPPRCHHSSRAWTSPPGLVLGRTAGTAPRGLGRSQQELLDR